VPLLHLNTVIFQGIKPRTEYLAFRTVGDNFIALDTTGRLFSWNMQTALLNWNQSFGGSVPYRQIKQNYGGFKTWETPLVKS
jgi:hypothetical protein